MNISSKNTQLNPEHEVDDSDHSESDHDSEEILDRLPRNKKQLIKMLDDINGKLNHYKQQFISEDKHNKVATSKVHPYSIPICANIL